MAFAVNSLVSDKLDMHDTEMEVLLLVAASSEFLMAFMILFGIFVDESQFLLWCIWIRTVSLMIYMTVVMLAVVFQWSTAVECVLGFCK